MMKQVKGNLIDLALSGSFDVIAHGCNCFCKQGLGMAKQMADTFGTDNFFYETGEVQMGNMDKLGTNEIMRIELNAYPDLSINVVNCYTQFGYVGDHEGAVEDPFDPMAIILCMRKLNHEFKGKHIGMPYISCGLASPERLRPARREWFERCLIDTMNDCTVTLVDYEKDSTMKEG